MILTIIIVVLSLIILMSLHEMGHFLLAKKFGITVSEFGIGYPPRIWGKKIKNTVYSINWLPLGAFVKILGEDENQKITPGSFASKPLWQRALVLFGGVAVFWIIAFLIITILAGISGVPTAVPDSFNGVGKEAPKVQIFSVAKNSPAELSGIKTGDEIKQLQTINYKLQTNQVGEIQQFITEHKGEEILFSLQRGDKVLDVTSTPRIDPPKGEGALGIALARVAHMQVAWYKAPWVGIKITALQTKDIPVQWYLLIEKKINKVPTPEVQLVGPVGLGQIMGQALGQGAGNYLMLVAIISIY
ncbi:MAG: site-2 protease family protein, partial [bacterium]